MLLEIDFPAAHHSITCHCIFWWHLGLWEPQCRLISSPCRERFRHLHRHAREMPTSDQRYHYQLRIQCHCISDLLLYRKNIAVWHHQDCEGDWSKYQWPILDRASASNTRKVKEKGLVHLVVISITNTIRTILSPPSLSNPSPSVWLFSVIDHAVHFIAISAREGEYRTRSNLLSGDCELEMEQI